ncbi:MAG: Hsp33 family molecular chaperone HslO [Myxococcota bacterium]
MRDALVRTVSAGGGIAVRAMVGTGLVAEAAARHGTSPVASVALGRALMGAVLLAAGGKHGESVQLQVRGTGPLGTLVAIADAEGRARGYVTHPTAAPAPPRDPLDVAHAVGLGVLNVLRQRADGRAPYNGIVPLVDGTIAQDLTLYLTESEQSESAVGLGVFLEPDGEVAAAGGFHVHALPGADPEEVRLAEENVRGFPGPGELVREGHDAHGIVNRLLAGLGQREIHEQRPVYHCGCDRRRVLGAVSLLEAEELEVAARDGETLEIVCQFCAERYEVAPPELRELAAGRRRG